MDRREFLKKALKTTFIFTGMVFIPKYDILHPSLRDILGTRDAHAVMTAVGAGLGSVGGSETFGNLGEGTQDGGFSANRIYTMNVGTPIHSGIVQKIILYNSNATAGTDIYLGFYETSGGTPGNKVGTEIELQNIGTWSLGWHEFNVSGASFSLSNEKSYCVAICPNGAIGYRYEATGDMDYRDHTYGSSWPNPFGTPDNSLDRVVSVKVEISY